MNKQKEQTTLITKYANSKKIVCLNCNKKIEKGFSSWCSFDCQMKFIKKYKLKTNKEIKNKVFKLIRDILKNE